MTDAKEAAERIVAYWKERGITDPAQCPSRNLDELRVALSLLAQPGEEEVKRVVARLSAMGLVVVPVEPTEGMARAMTALAPTWDDETSRRKWAAAITASKVQP